MISFLIPTYHYDCSSLVLSLAKQADYLCDKNRGTFDYEILVSDDGSCDATVDTLRKGISHVPKCRLLIQPSNKGLAHNRNLLARTAHFPYLLFMDSDAQICTDSFVEQYWQQHERASVVCGALRNPSTPPRKGCELRTRYEQAAESKRSAQYRNKHPYDAFTSFNVMIQRDVFQTLTFDERCTEYGYEDTLFGLMLEQHGISILHIENPLIHGHLDTNDAFLNKTETALHTLARLGDPLQARTGPSRLCRRLKLAGLLPLLRFTFHLLRSPLRRNLLGQHPSLWLFKVYKAGYYSTLTETGTRQSI